MRKFIITGIFLLIYAVSFGQDCYYVNRDEVLYRTSSALAVIRNVNKGEGLVILESNVTSAVMGGPRRTRVQTEDNNIGWLDINAISVVDSEILPIEITGSEWTHSYYLNVLRSGNRETLFIYELFWRDGFYRYRFIGNMHPEDERQWYEDARTVPIFRFHNIHTRIGDLAGNNFYNLINGKITSNNGTFTFSFVCTHKRITFAGTEMEEKFPVSERGTMSLRLDGDYMDVYVNDKKMFTLIKRNEELVNQFRNLMMNNRADLSRIVWPRRADGSMDFPPPTVSSNAPAQQVAEEPEEPVEIADYFEDQESVIAQENAFVQQNDDASSIPLWVWLAIAGGVVVIVALAVVMKRKR